MGLIVFFIIVAFIWAGIAGAKANAIKAPREKDEARVRYQNALQNLKADPTNADLKQQTLALGRAYSKLTRDKKGNTVFDEVALMNDINAACAGASSIERVSQATFIGAIEERLSKLSSLRSNALIDDTDFARRKKEILDSI